MVIGLTRLRKIFPETTGGEAHTAGKLGCGRLHGQTDRFRKVVQAAKVLGFPWAWLLNAWSARITLTMRELGKLAAVNKVVHLMQNSAVSNWFYEQSDRVGQYPLFLWITVCTSPVVLMSQKCSLLIFRRVLVPA